MKSFFSSIQFMSFLLGALMLMSIPSCVDLEFDQPPAGGADPNLPVNITIAELKARHTLKQFEQITDDITFSGIVISDDREGNFFKQLVIQDATGGIEMRIEMTDLNNVYPVGRKVYVKAKGLWLGDYNGLIQLGAGIDNSNPSELELIRIPESLIDQYIIPATYNNEITPKLLTIDQFSLDDVNTLIQLDGVQFVSVDAGQTYADTVLQKAVNRGIEDCSMKRVIIRSSGFASFAGEKTSEGNGTLVGVLGVFGGDYQIVIRDLSDVMMSGARCSTGGGGDINESFTSVGDEDDIVLPGWANIAVKGTRLWRGQEFSGNHYAQATSFGDTNAEMEAWLITPAIDLTTPKKLTFESAKAFHVQDGLTVWVSSNFNGSNVESATWTQLNPTIATSATTDHVFIPSGVIDLSGFSGTVRIGFKYVGSGPGGQTTSFRIDNVKVEN